MAPKKAKGQKMALADFFADQATGSWADETDDLPSAPAPKDPNALRRGDPGYFESRPDRGAMSGGDMNRGPPREELPLPTRPPYTAFVGNLTFETSEGDLSQFFGGLSTVSHKIISDFEGKPKGFGYVEFSTQDDLKSALDMTGGQLLGRTVRISVAEPPTSRGGPSAAEEASQWRRTGPLPTPAASSRPGRSFDSPREDHGERDWSAARGSKFTPAPPSSGGFRDGPRESSFQRENAGAADGASAWRSNKPLAQPVADAGRDAPPHQRGPQVTSPGLADTEQTWTRGSKLRVSEPGYARPARETTGESEGDWRGSRKGSAFNSRQGSVDGESASGPNSAAPSPQITRRALNLLPRNASSASTPAGSSEAGSASSANAAPAKASPFGAARPIDTAAREAEAAARLAKRDEERKAAAAAKAKAAADEKEKHHAQQRDQPKRLHPSRAESNQDKALSPPPAKEAPAPVKEKKEVATKEKKEANVRAAFSFAAAARAEGLVEESNEDEDVKDVTKGVDDVAV